MVFDSDPKDDYEHYQCEVCSGSIKLNENKTMWECDTCDFQMPNLPKKAHDKIK